MHRRLMAAALFAGLTPLASSALASPTDGGPTVPSSVQAIDPQKSFADGIEALKAEDYKKAEKKFGEVLSAAPKHPEANYFMGLAKEKQGKDKQAVKYFERAIKARDNFTEAREQLALLSIRLGDKETAVAQRDAIKSAIAACTAQTCDQAYMDRAGRAVERIETALAEGAAAGDSGKDAAEPKDGDDDDGAAAEGADDDDGGAAEDGPADGENQASAGAFDYARLFLDGEDAGAARYRAAVALINQGKYAEAIEDLYLAQAILGPHPDILNYLGYSNRKLGRMAEAQDYYGQALKLDPNHLGANEYLGELYLEIGEIGKAKRRLKRLDNLCAFACAEREALARLIDISASTRSAAK